MENAPNLRRSSRRQSVQKAATGNPDDANNQLSSSAKGSTRPSRRVAAAHSTQQSSTKSSVTTTTLRRSTRTKRTQASDASPSSPTSKEASIANDRKRKPALTVSTRQRSTLKKLKTVTPSPAAAAAAGDSTAFCFDTPRRQRPTPQPLTKKRQARNTPRNVADLYPVEKEEHPMLCSDTNHALAWCCADCNGSKETCSAESLTAQYIRVYGKEHWDALHAMDRPVITFPVSQEGADTERTEQDDQSREGDDGGHSASSASSGTSTATRLQTPRRNRNSVGRRFWTRYQSGEISPVTLFPGPEAPVESKEYLTEIGQSDLTPKMRAILVDWLIELSEHFSFGRETLHLAITMTDRVLASGPFSEDEDQMDGDESCYNAEDYDEMSFTSKCYKIRRSRYQLLGGACTWMACKLMELHAPKVIEFAYVSDGFYDVDQVKSMERRVCNALKFAFFQEPTPYQFLLEFLRASYEGDRLLQHADQCQHSHCGIDPLTTSTFHELANYLLELGRLSFTPVTQKPSLLAAAATYLARVTMNIRSPGQPKPSCDRNGFWTPTLHHYSGYSKQDLKETVLAVHAYQMAAENNTKLKAAFTKYKSRKYKRVALTTVVLQDQLGFDDGN